MPVGLYRDNQHACLMLTDLVEKDGQAVQANQFLIVGSGTGAIIDPGDNLAFNELFMRMTRHFMPQKSCPAWSPRMRIRMSSRCLTAGSRAHARNP